MPNIKRNMVVELGTDFFSEKFRGALFVHDGAVLKVSRVYNGEKVLAEDVVTGNALYLDFDNFPGFLKFQYPRLGYRKFGDNYAGFCVKEHTYYRGLRENTVHIQPSPVTYALLNEALIRNPDRRAKEKQFLAPDYDTMADADALLAGDRGNLVLSADVLIEPDVYVREDKYVIYYRKQKGAVMMPDKQVHYFNDDFKRLISPALRNGNNHA